jgi:hypothetical protein
MFSNTTIFLPHIVRCYRLFFIFKLSYFQTKKLDEAGNKRRIQIIMKLISPYAIYSIAGVLLAIHIALWLLTCGLVSIQDYHYFSFEGCGVYGLYYVFYLILVLGVIYTAVDIVFVCLLIRGVRDNYGIRYECFALTAMWIILLIVFTTLACIPIYSDIYEYQFSFGFILCIGLFIDSFVSCTLPCLLSFKKLNRNEKEIGDSDMLERILNNEEHRELLKTYAVQSFCPESIRKLIEYNFNA